MARQNRRKRKAFGLPQYKLNLDEVTKERLNKEGLRPRWINDDGGRLNDAEEGDYVFVEHAKTKVKTGSNEQEHTGRIRKQVGTKKSGEPLYAYLMAIPEEYYREDQEEKEKVNKLVDEAITRGDPPDVGHHGVDPGYGATTVKDVNYKP